VNVLQIVQAAAYELNIPAPSALVGATDTNALQLLNLFYSVGRDLTAMKFWPNLKRTYTMTMVSGQEGYQLPQDFQAAIPQTQWDRANRWQLNGPLWDNDYNFRLYGYVTAVNRRSYRIFGPDQNPQSTTGGQFKVNPTPTTSGDVLSFDYISRTFLFPPNWFPSTVVGASVYRNSRGNVYFTSAGGTTSTVPPSHTSGSAVDGTVTWTWVATYDNLLTDSDICLFEDDLMISGLKAMYAEAKGLDSTALRGGYDNNKQLAFSKWNPVPKISLADGGAVLGRYPNLSDGNFG
jgi:hypothetical protein